MTDEKRAKISAAMMGHTVSPETRAKIGAANRGHSASPETRARVSAALMGHTPSNKGVPPTDEQKAKKSAAMNCPEVRAKMSAAHLGTHHTPETRAKMSAAHWKCGEQVSNRRDKAHRRTLGFNPLNSLFVGCEGHHINNDDVIFIPKEMHRSISHNVFTGRNMSEINALAGEYLMGDRA